jgi:hypothetical protein
LFFFYFLEFRWARGRTADRYEHIRRSLVVGADRRPHCRYVGYNQQWAESTLCSEAEGSASGSAVTIILRCEVKFKLSTRSSLRGWSKLWRESGDAYCTCTEPHYIIYILTCTKRKWWFSNTVPNLVYSVPVLYFWVVGLLRSVLIIQRSAVGIHIRGCICVCVYVRAFLSVIFNKQLIQVS